MELGGFSIVSAAWLRDRIDSPDLVVIDCRFSLADVEEGRRQYDAAHIPGAFYLDLDRDLSGPRGKHGGRHPLPDLGRLVGRLEQMGVRSAGESSKSGGTTVVVYDDARFAFASRAWWLLRYIGHADVKVLDGGFGGWLASGFATTSDLPSPRAGRVELSVRSDLLVDRDEVLAAAQLGDPEITIVDAREYKRFLGEEEPIDPVAGRIPGAINRPWQDSSQLDGIAISKEANDERWAGIEPNKPIVVYCGSGVTACVDILSLARAGFSDVRLYAGSWSDWCSYQDSPIAVGVEGDTQTRDGAKFSQGLEMKSRAGARFAASDTYLLHRPSTCERRVYLDARATERAPRGAFEELLATLGARHEAAHLRTFDAILDLSSGSAHERAARTAKAIADREPALYQPLLVATAEIDGRSVEVVGEPDFLVLRADGYAIRDAKLAHRVSGKPAISGQLTVYGWLYERVVGEPPAALEILTGTKEIVSIAYEGSDCAVDLIAEIQHLREAPAEPESPVGWSKCAPCAFKPHCWPRAEAARDAALVPAVDQVLAVALRDAGIHTYDQLAERFDVDTLAKFERPRQEKIGKVGKKTAQKVLRQARALAEGREIWIRRPPIPDHRNFVMFDLEGIPPQAEDSIRIYLWGMQVFGEEPGPFLPAPRSAETLEDADVWSDFLTVAASIFGEYGDIPFVHYSPYEKTQLKEYIARHGDPDGVAARVLSNLLDLYPITKACVAIPRPSYSLKVVEQHVGFERSQDEFGGDWSIAKFIEATESDDIARRKDLLSEIWKYNEEDLAATWAVLGWLRRGGGS